MIPELGHFALIIALGIAIIQSLVPLFGAARNDAAMIAVARPAACKAVPLPTTARSASRSRRRGTSSRNCATCSWQNSQPK